MDEEQTTEIEYRRVYLLRGPMNDKCRGVIIGQDVLSLPYTTGYLGSDSVSELPISDSEADGYYIYKKCGVIRIDGERMDVFGFVERRRSASWSARTSSRASDRLADSQKAYYAANTETKELPLP